MQWNTVQHGWMNNTICTLTWVKSTNEIWNSKNLSQKRIHSLWFSWYKVQKHAKQSNICSEIVVHCIIYSKYSLSFLSSLWIALPTALMSISGSWLCPLECEQSWCRTPLRRTFKDHHLVLPSPFAICHKPDMSHIRAALFILEEDTGNKASANS